MSRTEARVVLAGTLLGTLLLVLVGPAPAEAVRDLRLAASAVEPSAPLVAALSLLAWALAGWLVLGVALTLLARAPGQAGRGAAAVTRRLVPPALRRLVGTALGATAVAGTMLVSPAAAVPAPAPPPLAAGPAPGLVVFDLDWPEVGGDQGPAPEAGAASAAAAPPVPDAVVVRPGDTLWAVAEHALVQQVAASAGATAPSAAQIACAWPSWWSANREVVGDDPHLLLPGTVLRPPSADPPP
jgi:nucleoid-associated protein YgaU